MTLFDTLLIAAFAVFVFAWWLRRTPARRIVLITSALAACGVSVAGYLDNRWQDGAGACVALVLLVVLVVTVAKNRITRTDRTGGVPFISGLCIAVLAAVPVVAIAAFPVWPLPRPSGQYAVGVRAFELADAGRPGVLFRQARRTAPSARSASGIRLATPRGARPRPIFRQPRRRARPAHSAVSSASPSSSPTSAM